MEFQNQYLESLISSFRSFSVEGFNIFALGSDNLPHLICVCPNKDFARAIRSLLTVAEKAKDLQPLDAYLTGNCYLSPKILADGTLCLVATVINDAVYLDGKELEYKELNLLLGSQAYEAFAKKFLLGQNEEGHWAMNSNHRALRADQAPVAPSSEATNSVLLKHWSNSEDLAFCIVNVLLCTNELLFEFVEYIKTWRLSEVADEVQRPSPKRRFDRLAECLKRLKFTLVDRDDNGEMALTETTVLDFAIDISFDEKELGELRAFGIAGASTQQVEDLAKAIRNYVEAAD